MAIELEVKLKDGVTVPAGSAAHQVEVLTGQLRGLQNAMIKANAVADEKAFQRAAQRYQQVGDRVKQLGGQLPAAADKTKALGAAQHQTASASNELVQGLTGVNVAALGTVAIVAAVAAGAAALAVGFTKLTAHAYEAASAHGLLLARLNAMSGSAKGGEQVVEMMRQLERVLPLTQKEMQPFVETMMRAGVRDIPRMTQGLKAAAASTAMLGDEGGKAMASFVADLNKSARSISGMGDLTGRLDSLGLTVEEVGKAAGLSSKNYLVLKAQLDGIASTPAGLQKVGAVIQDLAIRKGADAMKAMGATWDSVSKKMSEGLTRLFEDVQKTAGFKQFAIELQRFAQLFGLIDNASGGTKDAVTGAFNTIFKIAAKALEGIHIAILDLQIAFLQWRIALDPAIKKFNEFSDAISSRLPDWVNFENIVKGTAVIMAALAVSVGLVLAPFIAATAVVVGLGVALVALAGKAASLGNDIMMGIVEGIKKGADELKATWNLIIGGLPKALADKLQIKSPSRVMMRLGLALPQGLEQGIEQGSPDAVGATARMAMGVAGGGAVGVSAVAPSGRGGGVVVNLAPGSIQITGASGESETSLVEEAIVSMFERIALTQGVA